MPNPSPTDPPRPGSVGEDATGRTVTRRQLLGASLGVPLLVAAKKTTNHTLPLNQAVFIQHGSRTSKHIALSFHGAGPSALSRDLLALAKQLNAKITIFAVGTWVKENPSLLQEFKLAGHELANHTLNHPALRRVNRAGVAAEISGCAHLLQSATGSIGAWFRPSGTPTPNALILEESSKAGYPTVIGYDVDPQDYRDPGADLVVSRTLAGLLPGSIVSLHLGHQGTVDAFRSIVHGARTRGLEPVTVTTLLRP